MKLLAALGALLFSGTILATPLHNIVVFGDSLSDNGNLYELAEHQFPPSPPYYEGRFSNGPVWIEYLSSSYFPGNSADHLLNYAYGGAGVSEDDSDDVLLTLTKEINDYLATHQDKASEDSLFVVWIGANNYLALPEDSEKVLEDVNKGIQHSLERLADKGAKHIVVVNVPDLGKTPAAIDFDQIDKMSYLANAHNKLLDQTVINLKQAYPDVRWLYFDINAAFNDVLDHPQNYGVSNTTGTCAYLDVKKMTNLSVLNVAAAVKPRVQDMCEGYLFFDPVHPTALAHEILAEKARIMLDDSGVEFVD